MNNIFKVIGSTILVCAAIFITLLVKCNNENKKELSKINSDWEFIDSIRKMQYADTMEFVNGQLALQLNKNITLENSLDSLNKLSKKIIERRIIVKPSIDKSITTVPNEFINDCDTCFSLLGDYAKKTEEYKFQRDSYDSLMRMQNEISSNRINEIEEQKKQYKKFLIDSEKRRIVDSIKLSPRRNIKLNITGGWILNSPLGGGGFIYEDKKQNQFGLNVLGSRYGNIYLINAAKTISFR